MELNLDCLNGHLTPKPHQNLKASFTAVAMGADLKQDCVLVLQPRAPAIRNGQTQVLTKSPMHVFGASLDVFQRRLNKLKLSKPGQGIASQQGQGKASQQAQGKASKQGQGKASKQGQANASKQGQGKASKPVQNALRKPNANPEGKSKHQASSTTSGVPRYMSATASSTSRNQEIGQAIEQAKGGVKNAPRRWHV